MPRASVTARLKSDAATNQQVIKSVAHRQHQGMNNRVENSHRPTRTLLATDATIQIPRASERDFSLHLDQFETTFIRNNISLRLTALANSGANNLKMGEKLPS